MKEIVLVIIYLAFCFNAKSQTCGTQEYSSISKTTDSPQNLVRRNIPLVFHILSKDVLVRVNDSILVKRIIE